MKQDWLWQLSDKNTEGRTILPSYTPPRKDGSAMKNLYCVYDKVGRTVIGAIIQHQHDAPAIRQFHDALSMPDSLLGAHADDYTLIQIGVLEDATGLLLPMLGDSPVTVATGSAWKESKNA